MSNQPISIFWFRRDLRLHDNTGLYYALTSGDLIQPLFVFDTDILNQLEDKDDARVNFLHNRIIQIARDLKQKSGSIWVEYGKPIEIYQKLIKKYQIKAVYTNRDYEPYAHRRDEEIEALLRENGIGFYTFKDHVVFEKDEVTTDQGAFYKVFSPYKKRWMQCLESNAQQSYPSEQHLDKLSKSQQADIISLEALGFQESGIRIPDTQIDTAVLKNYSKDRNTPSVEGTTRLGIHLRHGTVSIRQALNKAREWSDTWLNELIWRDFYSMILFHNPQVVDRAFKPQYDEIPWRDAPKDFQKWCEGKTGYPIVDAGMRELNETGHMHNRVRMITASFLTKHLLIDWRWGEAYFARKLLDYELASNNGGWQWAAGTGTDAQPYFRIFNPYSQTEKFDKSLKYIRRWVKEIDSSDYPKPIVDHKFARERALDVFKTALSK